MDFYKTAAEFIKIFNGEKSYWTKGTPTGETVDGKTKYNYQTIRNEIDTQTVINHITGTESIGLCPIIDTKHATFCVLDIDDYGVDHVNVIEKLLRLGLSFLPCRSKSGGMHIYFFFREKEKIEELQKTFKLIRSFLDIEKVEFFPKQKIVTGQNLGSTINLPYFGFNNNVSYAYNELGKKVELEDFFRYAKTVKTSLEDIQEIVKNLPLADAPPCLQTIYLSGADPLSRNSYLFNLGNFLKAKYKENYKEKLLEYNERLAKPLTTEELEKTVLLSIDKKTYSYQCDNETLCKYCQKDICKQRDYGVGGDHVSSLDFGQLIQYRTDPPYYEWTVNNQPMLFKSETDLLTQRNFTALCMRELHVVPKMVKNEAWLEILNQAFRNVIVKQVDVEDDMSVGAMLVTNIVEFLTEGVLADNKTQLVQNWIWHDQDSGFYFFRKQALIDYLEKQKKFNAFDGADLQRKMQNLGGITKRLTIGHGKSVRVWGIPEKIAEERVEQLKEFGVDFEAYAPENVIDMEKFKVI